MRPSRRPVPRDLVERVYLSTAEVRRFLPWTQATVVERIRDGTLAGEKVGGSWLVCASSVWALCNLELPADESIEIDGDEVARMARELVS